MPTLALIYKL